MFQNNMLVRKTVTTVVPDLPTRIKSAQKRSGKSVESVCREVGISRQTWYNIENGYLKTGIDWDVLQKIESVLGISFGVSFD